MNDIIIWTLIVLFSFASLFLMVISIRAFYHKMWLAGAYCIFLSGIIFALEANLLKNMFKLPQTFFDSLMWVLAFCAIGLFITSIYDWKDSNKQFKV